MTTFTARFRWLVSLASVTLLALPGCSAEADPAPVGADEANSAASSGPAAPAPLPAAQHGGKDMSEQSIHLIRRPDSRVPVGARVVIGGPAIKVTAWSRERIWIQESGDSGLCEIGDEAVAYRAITVVSATSTPALATGQRVEIEGTVIADASGRRSIGDALVKLIGEPGEPYEAHCERDAVALASPALDDVLVLTAGTTENHPAPAADGTWSLTPCFHGEGSAVAVGASMASYESWRSGWHWLRGVRPRTSAGPRIEPRDADDFFGFRRNDACL